MSKGGTPKPHNHVEAHACAGRVLAKLGRPDAAAAEFEAAVASANPPAASMRFTIYEALALRDYARSARPDFLNWDVAAIRVRLDAAVDTIPATMAEIELMSL